MNFVNLPRMRRVTVPLFGLLTIVSSVCPVYAGETYSLELDELEKKNYEIGGFAEIKWEHMDIREDGAAAFLNFHDEPRSTLDRLAGSLQLEGSYTKGIGRFKWLAQGTASQSDLGWSDSFDLYEGFVSITPSPEFHAGLGKKSYKWGKGYAWNPVGFINRVKDPNNPEDALEGFVTAEAEWIRSFSGDLQNIALTSVLLPVWQDVNEDFGAGDNVNLAAKLYLLLFDTDIDFLAYTGNSRTSRFGLDFSRNITTNFEVHGEAAYVSNLEKTILAEDGRRSREIADATSYLAGIRYLNARDLTTIIEYYHNGSGFSEEEMGRFFDLVAGAEGQRVATGVDNLPREAAQLGSQGYVQPNPGRSYLYARFAQKEPFDILYFTPALTTIVNLDDQSFSLTPELIYTGFTNWEMRLQFALLQGGDASEFGEKQNSNRLELRARYYF
jgi:hypothetical protein